jgi:hypothetical protein
MVLCLCPSVNVTVAVKIVNFFGWRFRVFVAGETGRV